MDEAEASRRDALVLDKQIRVAIAMLSNSLGSGLSLEQGLRIVVEEVSEPLAPELLRLLAQCEAGIPLDAAIQESARRLKNKHFDALAGALAERSPDKPVSDIVHDLWQRLKEEGRRENESELQRLQLRARKHLLLLQALIWVLFICAIALVAWIVHWWRGS